MMSQRDLLEQAAGKDSRSLVHVKKAVENKIRDRLGFNKSVHTKPIEVEHNRFIKAGDYERNSSVLE